MKTLFLAISALAATASAAAANTDCYLDVSKLELVHGCFIIDGSGPGPCQEWESHGPQFSKAMTRTAINHYEIANGPVSATVVFDGKKHARVAIKAPGVNQTQTVGVSYENYDTAKQYPDANAQARFRDTPKEIAYDYDVRCSFGLSDAVASQEAADTAEMNRLGPAAEWADPTAKSVAQLPVGSIIEITKDITVDPANAANVFVEQNGLTTDAAFNAMKLQYRFAFARFYNANNGYMNLTRYAKGTRMEVTKIEVEPYESGGQGYQIYMKPVGAIQAADSIVRMEVDGRRSGASDIKIPQLQQLIAPAMSLTTP